MLQHDCKKLVKITECLKNGTFFCNNARVGCYKSGLVRELVILIKIRCAENRTGQGFEQ
jgi:hypothetical protein